MWLITRVEFNLKIGQHIKSKMNFFCTHPEKKKKENKSLNKGRVHKKQHTCLRHSKQPVGNEKVRVRSTVLCSFLLSFS